MAVAIANISGGEDAFNSLLFTPRPEVVEYLQQNMYQALDKLQGYNDQFVQVTQNMFNAVNSADAIQRAKQFLHSAQSSIDPNAIYPLYENNIYDANTVMQRYVMVEPTIRKLYEEQRCYGYDDMFLDINPDITAKNIKEHDDYRAVMDGVLQFTDDTGYWENYLDVTPLDIMDQVAVLTTWDTVKTMIAEGKDPTAEDEYDNEL